MPIFYDAATEGKKTSRLPLGVRDAGQGVLHLEKYTGADIIVSPLKDLVLPSTLQRVKPVMDALRAHCQAGMLVQRATGTDALKHITNLSDIQKRMREWGQFCYFVVVGYIGYNVQAGKATVGKKVTGWSYESWLGTVAAWQRRGGYYWNCPHDGSLLPWLQGWEKSLEKLHAGELDDMVIRRPASPVVPEDEKTAPVSTLVTLPHIGAKRGREVFGHCGGSLAQSLSWLSHPGMAGFLEVPGLTPKRLRDIQRWLGLDEKQYLVVETTQEGTGPVKITWPDGVYLTTLAQFEGPGGRPMVTWQEVKDSAVQYYVDGRHIAIVVLDAVTDEAIRDILRRVEVENI